MLLDKATVTGADDSVSPKDLLDLTKRFPFVEWGILLSRTREGDPRFPSLGWLERLAAQQKEAPIPLSGHLCGGWVRELCQGERSFETERPTIAKIFERVQLNFHAERHKHDAHRLARALIAWNIPEYILQADGVNNNLLVALQREGVNAVSLFDLSGGAGIEPPVWPRAVGRGGYAGGLRPERIAQQLVQISAAVGTHRTWVDIETHVRSDADKRFDLIKVEQYLTEAARYVRSAD